jgi:hypothetical protein
MLDYWKLWIYDKTLIERILSNKRIIKHFTTNEDGVLTGIMGKFQEWKIQTLSPVLLEITGSIHKYWNRGTNENDFSFLDAIEATRKFCNEFELNPSLVFVKNLEFGVNLQLTIDASEIIDQLICYNNKQPLRPYDSKPDCYFIEFAAWDYYLKVYDKGKQAREVWKLPNTPNTLRIEVKAMNSRFLKCAKIKTLNELLQPHHLQVLGLKIATLLNGLVFDDDTINPKELALKDRRLYRELCNPRKWKQFKGNTNSSTRKKIKRFKNLVERYGKRKIYSHVLGAVNDKILQLSENGKVADFLPNTYTWKTDTFRVCRSCGRDITNQHKNSRFCSAKYVGEREAHKCRNSDSNPRNNRRRKIEKINSKGVLFDIEPFVIDGSKKKRRRA